MAGPGPGSDAVTSTFLLHQAIGRPGARNSIFSLTCMLSSPLLSSGSWGGCGRESAKKDLEEQGHRGAPPAGFEKRGVFQAPRSAKTPPSGLEGGMGRWTR